MKMYENINHFNGKTSILGMFSISLKPSDIRGFRCSITHESHETSKILGLSITSVPQEKHRYQELQHRHKNTIRLYGISFSVGHK